MLYPVAPDKLGKFVERLHAACDAADIPRPVIGAPANREAALDEVDRYLDRFGELDDPVEGHLAVRYRGRVYLVVDAAWPSPLRTLKGDETVVYKDVPVGPSRLAMWAALQYLPETSES